MAPLVELSAARLLRRAPSLDAEVSPDVRALIEARREWLAGDSTAATASTDRAQREGADLGPLAEEYRLLRHDLGQSVGELPALDPPFQPYTRFSARWAMGKGGSVVRAPAP